MGVSRGAQTLHHLRGLKMANVATILTAYAREAGVMDANPQLTIDVDCSNACFIVGKSVTGLASLLMKWANAGFHVVPICDGHHRPISKQATNQRKANREKKRIMSLVIRGELGELRRRLYSNENPDDNKEQIMKEIAEKEKECKSAESTAYNVIPTNLDNQLSKALEISSAHSFTPSGGSVAKVITAEFQADAVLMQRSLDKQSFMVMSTDGDIPILVGDHCIAMKEFTKDGSITLVSTSLATLQSARSHLTSVPDEFPITPAKHPLFEGIDNRKVRALIALFLGCDVFPAGLKQMKMDNLSRLINEGFPSYKSAHPHRNTTLLAYLRFYLYHKIPNFDRDTVNAYIKALVHEPSNESIQSSNADEHVKSRTYLLGRPPRRLPKYLAEFAGPDTVIYDGPNIAECSGVIGSPHKFLSADGFHNCTECNHIVCQHCIGSMEGNVYCLQCYAQMSLVPLAGEDSGMPVNMMREQLAEKYDVDNVDELTMDEVEELYAMCEIERERSNNSHSAVTFPLHPSQEIDNPEHWTTILKVNLACGGVFLADPELDPTYIPGILTFMSSLVYFKACAQTDDSKTPPIFHSIPALFIDFANNSRVDSGYRILSRMIRHALDSKITPMDDCIAEFIRDKKGDIGIHLSSNVPASMKQDIYQTEVLVTSNNLLCCKCNCKCGSQGSQRIVCVHTLVRPYMLSLLLADDLAEHMLIELASLVNGSLGEMLDDIESIKTPWTASDINSMKQSILLLCCAAGQSVSHHDTLCTIREILEKFIVGTEQRKVWKQKCKLPPKSSELAPIESMKLYSTARIAKDKIGRNRTCING